MDFAADLLLLSFLLLLWLTCVFEAFDGLSGGRIRKIEAQNEPLAEKLDAWMERAHAYRAILKLLLFVVSALIGTMSYQWLYSIWPSFTVEWGWVTIVGGVVLAASLAELLARLLLFRLDIFVLRLSMPILSFVAGTLFRPLVMLLDHISKTTEDWHRNDSEEQKVSVEDEILSFVESYDDDTENDLEEGEKRMIRGILEIGDMSVREIMTPRVDLTALPSNATVAEAIAAFLESGHSRIPVYERSIDEIRGILYAKDFLEPEKLAGRSLLQVAHKPIFIPETKEVVELLEEIKRSRNHFAVIIDEYGGTSGVVTFEDIIEEIVGEVHDEYDTESDFHSLPQLMPDGSIVMEARTLISDINDIADTEIPDDDDSDTIGGYICAQLGRIPAEGDEYVVPGQLRATILSADKRKIKRIRLEIIEEAL